MFFSFNSHFFFGPEFLQGFSEGIKGPEGLPLVKYHNWVFLLSLVSLNLSFLILGLLP